MTRTLRVVAFVILGTLLVGLLAACGGGDDPTPTTASAGDVATAIATEPSQATTSPQATIPSQATATTGASATATTEPTTAPTATEPPAATVSSEATATAPEDTAAPDVSEEFAYGFNVFARGDDNGQEHNERTIGLIQDAGFGWIRIQIYWRSVQQQRGWWDPLGIDRIVEQYGGEGIRILASISAPPDWALDPTGERLIGDMDAWQEFVAFLADRYQGRIHAWEVWNEQNLAYTFGGEVRLGEYAELLERAYTAIKDEDPEALVLFGGLTPTGVNDPSIAIDDVQYLEEFYQYEGGRYTQYFDVLGAHANATNNPPDTMWPDNPGTGGWSDDASFYFRRVEQLRDVMMAHGDDRPVWITEFGWTTENQQPGYEYGVDISEEDQAEYLVRALEIGRHEWDWCTGMFVWNLNFSTVTEPGDEKHPWSVIYSDWTPRPAYEALAAMPKD